jgi:hypothetical protein
MQILDADKGERLESSTGRVASRDIVQFVPFRDVQSKSSLLIFISFTCQLVAEILTIVCLGCDCNCRWRDFGCSSTSCGITVAIFNLHADQRYPTNFMRM